MSLTRIGQGGLLVISMLCSLATWAADFSDLLAKAEKGDQVAMLAAGKQLVKGEAKPTKNGEAETLLAPLADKGQAEAMLWLGKAYRDGLGGVSKDLQKSFTYLERAAGKEGKLPQAQYELGKSYYEGAGTDRNLIAAYMWTSLSLEEPSSSFEDAARQQQKTLSGMLNKAQLEKAKELVSQIKSIYLQEK